MRIEQSPPPALQAGLNTLYDHGLAARRAGWLDQAADAWTNALAQAAAYSPLAIEAKIYTQLGELLSEAGDYQRAIDYFMDAQHTAQQLNEVAIEVQTQVGLAQVQGAMSQFATAHELLYVALARGQKSGLPQSVGLALLEHARCYNAEGKLDEALAALDQAIPTLHGAGEHDLLSNAFELKAILLSQIGLHEQAMVIAKDALSSSDDRGNAVRVAEIRQTMAMIHLAAGKTERALELLDIVHKDATSMGLSKVIAGSHHLRARAHEKDGNYRAAMHEMVLLRDAERYLVEQESFRRIASAKLELQFTQKERETLQAQEREAETARVNDELRHLNNALALANQEKTDLIAQLETLSRTDVLSGLFNRRYLFERLENSLAQNRRSDSALVVAMLDIDHFKRVNDNYSHAIGDAVIKALGGILKAQCRESDFAARYGGEEFVCVLHSTNLESAFNACERIRKAVENYDWASIETTLRVTASIGLALSAPNMTVTSLLNAADGALYQAKHAGRNRVVSTNTVTEK